MTLDRLLSHPEIVRLARALKERPGRTIEPEPNYKWAAIALVIRPQANGEPELLMIKRAEIAGDPWSGHIAVPGGRAEPGDRDLQHTATRETLEETGIDLEKDGMILGTLDDLSPRTPMLPPIVIRPFVAAVPSTVRIVASSEVAESFWMPLAALRNEAAWSTSTVKVRGTDREELSFRHHHYMVWGLTHRVLRQLVELMGPADNKS
jgi:8-oxo-dGTP pyrophosphatase MutT (NUDIX family)